MNVYTYKTRGGKDVILSYLDELPKEEKADGLSIIAKLEEEGLKALEVLDTRQLIRKLWEIRFGSSRIMYVVADEQNIYLLHACKKQKPKTEGFELHKAIKRVKELQKITGKKYI